MRKTMYALASFLLAVSMLSCHLKSNPSFENSALNLKNDVQNFEISFNRTTANANYLEAIDSKQEATLLRRVNIDFAPNKMVYTKLLNYNIHEGTKKTYLEFQGYCQAEQKLISFAYEIQLNKEKTNGSFVMTTTANGRVAAATDTHSCSGAPCSCCSFVKDAGGVITGCNCNQVLNTSAPCYGAPGVCNHTIVGGGQVAWGQCGGEGWTGITYCSSGQTCVYINQFYSQCQP